MSKADRTRAFIIEKTAPVFNKKGYVGTSISDLTEATGLTKGSIYGNFPNKDAVAMAVFDHNLNIVTQIIRKAMSRKRTVKGKLMVYTEVYSNYYSLGFPPGGCPILNTSVEADDTHPELREKAAYAVMDWKNRIASLIQEGINNGEFKNAKHPRQTALTIVAMIEGAVMIAGVTGKMGYLNAVMASLKQMINEL